MAPAFPCSAWPPSCLCGAWVQERSATRRGDSSDLASATRTQNSNWTRALSAAMGSQTLAQLTAAFSSPSSSAPHLSWPLRSVVRAIASERPWIGNCAGVKGHFNPLSSSPVNRSTSLRQSQAIGHRSRGQLRLAASFGKKPIAAVKETIIPDPDYRIPIVLLGAAGAFIYSDNLFAAAPVGLLGLLLLFQTTRVKFVFEDDSLEVKIGEDLKDSGDNVFVGGENRWKYSSFINWEFWWPSFPVLVYFKETQTKPEGQIHFFPVIFNGKQVYEVMAERCGFSKTSGPK